MSDIENRNDIELLVNTFYEHARSDKVIGYFFNEVVEINWPDHIQKITDFWETTLLGNMKYTGNPMSVHFEINQLAPLEKSHFQQWIVIFERTVDELFSGENATTIKERAKSIALLMNYKISQTT
ncbi:MAG: group III truncated hemoglobin [Cyclobacteriaceae bacterium]|nr:group III truncated hemoglobin [Cyclobacteriaceae bacterium]